MFVHLFYTDSTIYASDFADNENVIIYSVERRFTDVEKGKSYYNAVVWLQQNHIAAGVGGSLYGTGRDCTRAQMVQFLYNMDQNLK